METDELQKSGYKNGQWMKLTIFYPLHERISAYSQESANCGSISANQKLYWYTYLAAIRSNTGYLL
ncbi:hypothetical protein CIAN88_00815 [[Clostridium] innocuum]|uniref:Uncharacterized protein n=1 Tax=Clostridium innocuum TaxID=1522 RepID=A0A099IBR3_CLOIN|nr:hypothetical protein CIAN88_00815 [[Clostridium] innocuum]